VGARHVVEVLGGLRGVGGMHSCGQGAHWTGDRHLAPVGARSVARAMPRRVLGAHTAVVTSLVCVAR
jgi:hypothetical protein